MTHALISAVYDLRHSVRGLLRRPGFSLSVIATLALGMGASTAVFAVVDSLMLRPLPFREPERLYAVLRTMASGSYAMADWLRPAEARHWLESAGFSEYGLSSNLAPVRIDGEPETLRGQAVTPDLLPTVGITPAIGRGITADDALPGAPAVVLLSYDYWTRMGADPAVLGTTMRFESGAATVVGVLPRNMRYPYPGAADVFFALASDNTVFGLPAGRVNIIVRTEEGENVAAAQARVDALARALDESNPVAAGWKTRLQSVANWRGNSDLRQSVWMLAGAVLLMLLIALVNSSSLLLVRATARSRELTVRLALGASAGRVVSQQLAESLVLGLVGGGLAVLLADWSVSALNVVLPSDIRFAAPFGIEIQGRVLLFAFALSIVGGLLCGLAPAAQSARARLSLMPMMSVYDAASRARNLTRNALVVGQIALAITLLAGAGLFTRSFAALMNADHGYEQDGLLLMSVQLPGRSYPNAAARLGLLRELQRRIAALPTVEGVTLAEGIPPNTGFSFDLALEAEDIPPRPAGEQPRLLPWAQVEPDFFQVLGTRLIEGRVFTRDDHPELNYAVIDRPLARFLWGDASAVGKRFRLDADSRWRTVIGVVDDVRLQGPDDRNGNMDMFVAMSPDSASSFMSLAIRYSGSEAALLPAVRQTFRGLAPTLPIYRLQTVRQAIVETVQLPRFLVIVMLAFSAVALVLAALGVFSTLSFAVNQQARALAIRMVVGANARALKGMILRHGLLLAVLGSSIGLLGAFLLARLVAGLLFGISPTDGITLAAVTAVMITVAALAAYWPAHRATRFDPMQVLKADL